MGNETRRVTVHLPAKLLEDAMEITGKGITATLREGLVELIKRHDSHSDHLLRSPNNRRRIFEAMDQLEK